MHQDTCQMAYMCLHPILMGLSSFQEGQPQQYSSLLDFVFEVFQDLEETGAHSK